MNKYYFVIRDLYQVFYLNKNQTFREQISKNNKKKIGTLILFILAVIVMVIGNSIINNIYCKIVSLVIIIIFLFILRNILKEVTVIDISTMNDSYKAQIRSFSEALETYEFDSKSIEGIMSLIQENIKKKEQKSEVRSRYTFQFFLVLFGVIGFLSKELWHVLGIATFIKSDILTSIFGILILIFFLLYILMIIRAIMDPQMLKYSDEEKILTALQEVLMYREKENQRN